MYLKTTYLVGILGSMMGMCIYADRVGFPFDLNSHVLGGIPMVILILGIIPLIVGRLIYLSLSEDPDFTEALSMTACFLITPFLEAFLLKTYGISGLFLPLLFLVLFAKVERKEGDAIQASS